MFNKIKCKFCGKKFDKSFSYCPFCGRCKTETDFFEKGLLDELNEFPQLEAFPMMFSKIFSQVEKQFREIDKELKVPDKKIPITSGISISVNMSNEGKPEIKIRRFGEGAEGAEKVNVERAEKDEKALKKQFQKKFNEKDAKRLAKLPRQEPATTVRRFSDKIVYEINLPGVEKKNIVVNKLQNSIEIKAFSKDKAFLKLIPVSLPLRKWSFDDGRLILELKPET